MKKLMMALMLMAGAGIAVAATGHGEHHRGKHDPAAMMQKMAERLELSEQQTEQVRAVMNEVHPRMQAAHANLRQSRAALQELSTAAAFDATAIRAAADAHGAALADMMVLRAEMRHRIGQELTEEQRARMEEMHGKHGKKGDHRKHAGDTTAATVE